MDGDVAGGGAYNRPPRDTAYGVDVIDGIAKPGGLETAIHQQVGRVTARADHKQAKAANNRDEFFHSFTERGTAKIALFSFRGNDGCKLQHSEKDQARGKVKLILYHCFANHRDAKAWPSQKRL